MLSNYNVNELFTHYYFKLLFWKSSPEIASVFLVTCQHFTSTSTISEKFYHAKPRTSKYVKCTYIIRCGEYSIREVVVGEIRSCIYSYKGHLVFSRSLPLHLTEWLKSSTNSFQMFDFAPARLPLHSQSRAVCSILPNPDLRKLM